MGSSPRGRGKLHAGGVGNRRSGLIPARAGKTIKTIIGAAKTAAHPRAGGENRFHLHSSAARSGSSPRGRGKRAWALRLFPTRRLIPARAGKTFLKPTDTVHVRAHPRAGGENRPINRAVASFEGSSPRGRGKLAGIELRTQFRRLIPARAGKTGAGHHAFFAGGAHPRAGGENIPPGSRRVWIEGSSPRGRGKPTQDRITSHDVGLIPARAGKTSIVWSTMRRRTAHPRAGGENALADQLIEVRRGSSPRGRGKREQLTREPLLPRLIPARAGKTDCDTYRGAGHAAHPRAGGENARITHREHDGGAHPRAGGENEAHCLVPSGVYGSSPRGRGKLIPVILSGILHGLIPARAGKTWPSA